jgi:hypothetical protein
VGKDFFRLFLPKRIKEEFLGFLDIRFNADFLTLPERNFLIFHFAGCQRIDSWNRLWTGPGLPVEEGAFRMNKEAAEQDGNFLTGP